VEEKVTTHILLMHVLLVLEEINAKTSLCERAGEEKEHVDIRA
jgi:hypothetical protein